MKLRICELLIANLKQKTLLSETEIISQIIEMINLARSKSKSPECGQWRRKFPNTSINLKIAALMERYSMPPMICVMAAEWRTFDNLDRLKTDIEFEKAVLTE